MRRPIDGLGCGVEPSRPVGDSIFAGRRQHRPGPCAISSLSPKRTQTLLAALPRRARPGRSGGSRASSTTRDVGLFKVLLLGRHADVLSPSAVAYAPDQREITQYT